MRQNGGEGINISLKSATIEVCEDFYIEIWYQLCTDWYTVHEGGDTYNGTTCGEPYARYEYSYTECHWEEDPEEDPYGGYIPPPCNCETCPICGGCLNSMLKSASTSPLNCPAPCLGHKSLPQFSSFSSYFSVVAGMTALQVYQLVGGNVYANHLREPDKYNNACALRLSYALNMFPGHEIAYKEGVTVSGDTNNDGVKEWYFLKVSAMVEYLNSTYGNCMSTTTNNIQGQTGIIWESTCGWGDATGHVDVWNGSNAIDHYYPECEDLYFWKN
jgi:hypothetical protein